MAALRFNRLLPIGLRKTLLPLLVLACGISCCRTPAGSGGQPDRSGVQAPDRPAIADPERPAASAQESEASGPAASGPAASGRAASGRAASGRAASGPEASAPLFTSSEPVDLIISGGRVIDGTGTAPRVLDVVVEGQRITHVGRVAPNVEADQRINAEGLVVTPGFIDVHAHAQPLVANKNSLAMGVTTVVVGQDGRSPTNGRLASWFKRVERSPLSVNVASLVGHATVRGLAGVSGRHPSDAGMARMLRALEEELDAGAFGLSFGLEYHPGIQAGQRELDSLAAPVAARDAIIMSHLRSEDDELIDAAVDELISQGQLGARVHVAHIKIVRGKGEARAEALLKKMDAARAAGISITADWYPYNASYTTIGILFPNSAKAPDAFTRARKHRRDKLAASLKNTVIRRGGPETVLFGTGPYSGKTLAEVASAANKRFEDVLIDDIGPRGASAAFFVMDEALQARLFADPWIMVASDGGEHSSHPRGHGTFARVIADYVLERNVVSLTEAVRKMTGLCAATLRLKDRGTLHKGHFADILVFDPTEVQHHATYHHPRRRSTGMRWVFVNGQPAIADGKLTGSRTGKLLRARR